MARHKACYRCGKADVQRIRDCLQLLSQQRDGIRLRPVDAVKAKLMEQKINSRQVEFLDQYYSVGMKMKDIAKRSGVDVSSVSRSIAKGRKAILDASREAESIYGS